MRRIVSSARIQGGNFTLLGELREIVTGQEDVEHLTFLCPFTRRTRPTVRNYAYPLYDDDDSDARHACRQNVIDFLEAILGVYDDGAHFWIKIHERTCDSSFLGICTDARCFMGQYKKEKNNRAYAIVVFHRGNFSAPPGEEDEEEGLRKEYAKSQDKEANAHTIDRNGQSGYKPRRSGTGTSGSTSGYASSGSRSHRDESSGSPSQPKIIFNEDEYTRITTPRQDVLFKKGYLSRKKPWTGNASTSATPSTTESQSASHSTAGEWTVGQIGGFLKNEANDNKIRGIE